MGKYQCMCFYCESMFSSEDKRAVVCPECGAKYKAQREAEVNRLCEIISDINSDRAELQVDLGASQVLLANSAARIAELEAALDVNFPTKGDD